MVRRNSMPTYSWAIFLLLLGLSWGQTKRYFEWKPAKAPRHTSLLPYVDDVTTSNYDSRYYDDNSAPYGTTGYYPDSSMPYINDGPYSDDSYSADFPKSQPYQYPGDTGSYENYGYTRDDNFNITIEKYGGFGGTGDTRGYGAYDYPKKVQEEVPQELHHDIPKIVTDFPDLLRLGGRSKVFHRRNPVHVHPLPPPL